MNANEEERATYLLHPSVSSEMPSSLLPWLALDHSSVHGRLISYMTFLLLTFAVPSLTPPFNPLVQLPLSSLSLLAFLSITRLLHRFSLPQLLFLDAALRHDPLSVRSGYGHQLHRALRCLAFILIPSFFLQLIHQAILLSSSPHPVLLALTLASWVYRSGLFLGVCLLFRVTCELQILRFNWLQQMLLQEGCECDAGIIFREHSRIKREVSVTSHRYRFFIIGSFVVITASQFAALLLLLASKSHRSFFNSADLLVCSMVELSGFFMCLMGATRITHRAQGMASVASRWHMAMTLARTSDPTEKSPPASQPDCSEGDNDSDDVSCSDIVSFTTLSELSSSFQVREALVCYFQHNGRGITLFGYALDRGLLHTIFAFEFSLVMWILSKVVVLS